jgi:hypothetical protein
MDRRKEELATKEQIASLTREFFTVFRDENDDELTKKKKKEIENRISGLSPAEIKRFIAECSIQPDINEGIKNQIEYFVIGIFNKKYPIEMAAFISYSPEYFGAKSKLARDGFYRRDPFFYLIYNCRQKEKDINLAFRCLAAAEPSFQAKYIDTILNQPQNSEQRNKLLPEMRAFAITPEQVELVNNTMGELAFGPDYAKLTFAEVSSWLESANLSSDELVGATKEMQNKVRVGETGQWLDWLAKSDLSDEVAKVRAFELASRWTDKDYQAVGQWLNRTPDSPEKAAVASAYAAKTYPYDPENAKKWLQTLPQGPDRTKALMTIYQRIPRDSDEAQAFENEYGLRE